MYLVEYSVSLKMYLVEYSVSRNPAQRWLKRKIRFSKIKYGVPRIPTAEQLSITRQWAV